MDNINELVVDMFIEISSKINDYYIFKEERKFRECLLKKIYKIWGKHVKSYKLDYNDIASSFNKVYFWKNLLKNLIFFDSYYDLIGNSILDVGCGAAPSSIAIGNLVKNRKGEDITISLIDKSTNQLSIAKDLLQILSFNVNAYSESIFDINCEKYYEFVVFSYFFCEQKQEFLKILFDSRGKFFRGFAVIDYRENIFKIEKYFKDNGDDNIKSIILNYLVPDSLLKFIQDKEINVYGCFYRP